MSKNDRLPLDLTATEGIPARWPTRARRRRRIWRNLSTIGSVLLGGRRALAVEPYLTVGLRWLPGNPFLLMLHALGAQNSGRFPLAVERWTLVCAALPNEPMPPCRLSTAYRHCGIYHSANEEMERAAALFPDDLDTMVELAVVSAHFSNLPRAAECWLKAIELSGGKPFCLAGAAQILLLLGRFDEADAIITRGRDRYPEDRSIAAAQGMLASAREDWPAAVSLWSAYHERFPQDATGWEHLGRAIAGSQLAQIVEPGPAPDVQQTPVDDETAQLLLRFQSIGSNCEFGLVQRRFGVEPLGLLRWNPVLIPNLIAALDERFAGMGEAENVKLEILGNGSFFARDRRWDLGMHTFQFVGQIDQATLHARMCRRVAYLRDKFLADLAEGRTIFVYRSDAILEEQVRVLLHALRRHGPARLLVVRVAAGGDKPGQIRILEDGCWLGSTRRSGVAIDLTWDIPFEDWLAICRGIVA